LGAGTEHLADFLNGFTFSVARNRFLDEALFDAHRDLTTRRFAGAPRRDLTPPILIVPQGRDTVLAGIRLENQVRNLTGRLARLPYDTYIGRRSNEFEEFGISSDSRIVADYLRDLDLAIAQGRARFELQVRGLHRIDVGVQGLHFAAGELRAGDLVDRHLHHRLFLLDHAHRGGRDHDRASLDSPTLRLKSFRLVGR
jgi:hypothetical protein